MTYNIKIVRIWITIIRHRGLGHKVQASWPSTKCDSLALRTESRGE